MSPSTVSLIESGRRDTPTKVFFRWIQACRHSLQVTFADDPENLIAAPLLNETERTALVDLVGQWESLDVRSRRALVAQWRAFTDDSDDRGSAG